MRTSWLRFSSMETASCSFLRSFRTTRTLSWLWAHKHDGSLMSAFANVVLAAVQQHGDILTVVSKEIMNNESVVSAAAQQHGDSLMFTSGEVKNYEKVVLAAVLQQGGSFMFASGDNQQHGDSLMFAFVEVSLDYVAPRQQHCVDSWSYAEANQCN